MTTILKSNNFSYEVAEDWAQLPDGWSFKEVAAVGVDSRDCVYVFNRGSHPVMIFNRDGMFLRSWGEDIFKRAHGITMGPDDTVYCTDDYDHTVRKCTQEGRVLLTLGTSGDPATFHSGHPFNRCTHVALCPTTGNIYVSDGYGNARVHKYDPNGKHLFSWGTSGTEPGQFNIVHNICTDSDGYVYVADRENQRIQIFNPQGRYQHQWINMAKPCGLYISNHRTQFCYVGELGAAISANEGAPGLGPRVSIYDLQGNVLARLGDTGPGNNPGRFLAPHGISVDSYGDIYVGEVSWTSVGSKLSPPKELRSLQKLINLT